EHPAQGRGARAVLRRRVPPAGGVTAGRANGPAGETLPGFLRAGVLAGPPCGFRGRWRLRLFGPTGGRRAEEAKPSSAGGWPTSRVSGRWRLRLFGPTGGRRAEEAKPSSAAGHPPAGHTRNSGALRSPAFTSTICTSPMERSIKPPSQ